MILAIDWGNTLAKAALFNVSSDKIVEQHSWPVAEAAYHLQVLIGAKSPKGIILSAVTDVPQELTEALSAQPNFLRLNSEAKLPVMNAYHSPETLGPDRLAAVVAANHQFPEKNNLVITAGTCITYNLITTNRTYRGGAISPGIRMRLDAMHHFTGKLPEVELKGELLLLGYDTETCMRSGALYGAAAEVVGMIKAYGTEYPLFNPILTGGDAPFLARQLKMDIFADPDLVLKGLFLILKYNVPSLR